MMHLALAALILTGQIAASGFVQPPPIVMAHLDSLQQLHHVADLPGPIRDGTFAVPEGWEKWPHGWRLADPGAPWQATDVIMQPGLPGRRMIVAGCDSTVCVLHYESGGIAHLYDVMAFLKTSDNYKVLWHAWGTAPFPEWSRLLRMLKHGSNRYHEAGAEYN